MIVAPWPAMTPALLRDAHMNVTVTVTDTFAGEANFSWVRKYEFTMPKGASDLAVMRRVKQEAGLAGARCSVDKYGDEWRLDVRGACVCAFVSFDY